MSMEWAAEIFGEGDELAPIIGAVFEEAFSIDICVFRSNLW